MRFILILFALVSLMPAFSQEARRSFPKEIILKSNLLSLLAQRPTVSIEKVLPHNFTAEVSFVQGQFNNILFTDHIDYKGYLVRVKKHFSDIQPGSASLYGGVYLGTLKRRIYTTDPGHHSKGYLDAQVWLSAGYCF